MSPPLSGLCICHYMWCIGHVCAIPSGDIDMHAPMQMVSMSNSFIACTNANGAFVNFFWKNGYIGKYFETMVIFGIIFEKHGYF